MIEKRKWDIGTESRGISMCRRRYVDDIDTSLLHG